ncbi:tRNA (guanine(26)-N(2))-dimethyltransferase [Halococcus saccharolyticus]|uniref:tRNA (guanine(26)-N(2))-dimethyltransferase n=1 Tax=Halococcus saccharolyticus DSM 5350 TaxID=1227455 RepID=M0MG71_9EURY|nr:tRNA (guanine(26)-N(2))-dimethyltransferase [Halococcus saccharolyticus]EMA43689.1 N(2),N(2)-dimethylguanosine tRNA methyltransferase [Halococcus saccharolyticus DSM 5350]
MQVSEGGLSFRVPEQPEAGIGDDVFFNSDQELNRDLTVAVLRTVRDREDRESYLDATAATGVRGVRAANEGYDATLCDVDSDATDLCRANLERNDLDGRVKTRNANALMHEERFDVVDLDPFGTPIPFADAAFRSARHLVCVTATDTAPLCGAHKESGIRSYSAVPQNTEYHPEMGLRILLGALVRTAARYDVAAIPVLSHATSHYVRTYLDLSRRASDANDALESVGHVHHCFSCLHRESETGLTARPPDECPVCGANIRTAGPLWLDQPHDRGFVGDVRERLTDELSTAERARDLLDTLDGELDSPTHYDQHRLCREWGRSASAMDEFLDRLRGDGFTASRTHYGGTTFKTDATVAEIETATEPDGDRDR